MEIALTIHSNQEPSQEIIDFLKSKGDVKYVIRDDVEKTYKEFIIDQTGNRYNFGSSASGNYIPLTGTVEGNPITGGVKFNTIEISSEKNTADENSNSSGVISTRLLKDGKNFEASSSFNSDTFIGVSQGKDYSSVNTSMNTSGSYFILSDQNTYDALGGVTNHIYGLTISSYDSVFTKFNGFVGQHLTQESALTDKHFIQKAYVDKINSYSNVSEKTGGTWVDGKRIYRKVITKTVAEIGQYNYFDWVYLAESLVDNLVNITGFFTLPNGNVFPFGETVVKYSANQEEDIKYNISWWLANDLEQDLYRVLYLRGTISTFNATTQQWEESPISEISYTLTIEYTKTNELINF